MSEMPHEIRNLLKQHMLVYIKKKECVIATDYEGAADARTEEKVIIKNIENMNPYYVSRGLSSTIYDEFGINLTLIDTLDDMVAKLRDIEIDDVLKKLD